MGEHHIYIYISIIFPLKVTSFFSPICGCQILAKVYKAKVEELAHRGFYLKSLMKFWDELLEGELMPSFDPHRSQTNDVVRQAIIPSSRVGHGGFALARIQQGGGGFTW